MLKTSNVQFLRNDYVFFHCRKMPKLWLLFVVLALHQMNIVGYAKLGKEVKCANGECTGEMIKLWIYGCLGYLCFGTCL